MSRKGGKGLKAQRSRKRGRGTRSRAGRAARQQDFRAAEAALRANIAALRKHLLALLRGGSAHATSDDVLEGWPSELRGAKPAGAPHTAWELLEHLRIAQRDILEFLRNAKHVSPAFPAGYWPASQQPPDDAAWQRSVREFRADLREMEKIVADPQRDLYARVRHPEAEAQHTLLREALVLADHNAYHLGQMVLLRRLLGCWPQ
jgi:hypothetical protein